MFSSELQLSSATVKLFHLEQFVIYSIKSEFKNAAVTTFQLKDNMLP